MLINIATNVEEVLRELDEVQYRQMPYATMVAINNTMAKVVAAEEREIRDVFDRPTPSTQGSIARTYASKQKLTARTYLKDFSGKGTPATKYLTSQIEGGARRMKRFEIALQSVGALPTGFRAVPGDAAKMDAYGNIDRGQIVQILAFFKAFPEMGYKANISDKRRAAMARGNKRTGALGYVYFVGRPGDRLPLGIWQRVTLGHGNAIKPVMIFVPHANYKKLFDFDYVGQKVIDREFIDEMKKATAEALRTAR